MRSKRHENDAVKGADSRRPTARSVGIATGLALALSAATGSAQAVPPMSPWLLAWRTEKAGSAEVADWWNADWHYRIEVAAPFSYVPRKAVPVAVRIDFEELRRKLRLRSRVDPNSPRVVEVGGREVPSRLMADAYAAPDDGPGSVLAWTMRGTTEPKQQRRFHIYFDTVANGPKPAPGYTAPSLPKENRLRNGDFARSLVSGLPGNWRVDGGGMAPADFLSVAPPETEGGSHRLRLQVDADNREQVTSDAFRISQRVKLGATDPAGQTWMAAATFFLAEGGSGGCPVGLRVTQFDREGRTVREETGISTHRSFFAAPGQRVTAVIPIPLDARADSMEVALRIRPALHREIPGQGTEVIRSPESDMVLYVSDLVLRPDNEIPLEHNVPHTYVPGVMADAPRNSALLLKGDDTFFFNTFPTMRSYGIGKARHFDIRKGTVEMWVRPDWDREDGETHVFFQTLPAWRAVLEGGKSGPSGPHVELAKLNADGRNRLRFLVRDQKRRHHKVEASVPFEQGRWTHLAAAWDFAGARMALFVDGKKVGELEDTDAWPVEVTAELLEVGNAHHDGEPGDSETRGRWSADAAIDELRISGSFRYRGSFRPPKKEFKVDRHTLALFHFEGDAQGIHYGGDGFVPSMTTQEAPYRERFIRMDRRNAKGQVEALKVRILPLDADEKAERLSANVPPWLHARELLPVRHPAPGNVRTEVVHHEEVIDATAAAFDVEVGGDYPPAMRSLRIEPIGPESSVRGMHVWTDGTPDLSSPERLFQSALRPGMTDREKAIALFGFAGERMPWWTGAAERGEIQAHDPIKALNCYGGMICSSQSRILADLYVAAGLSAKTLGIGHHVVCEVFYDGDWHLMDMTYGMYALKRDCRTVASWDDYALDQFLGEQVAPPDGSVAWNTGDSRSWAYHYLYFRSDNESIRRREFISLDADLLPGMAYDRLWHNRGKRNEQRGDAKFNYWDYGNGELRWTPDLSDAGLSAQAVETVNLKSVPEGGGHRLTRKDVSAPAEVVYEVRSPYVIVDAIVTGITGGPPPEVRVSVDGGAQWTACGASPDEDMPGGFVASADSSVNAVYSYLLKLTLPAKGAPEFLEDIQIRTVFQTNVSSLPALARGKNRVSFEAQKLTGRVRVRCEWVERYESALSVGLNALSWYPVRQRDYNRVYFARPGEAFDVRVAASHPRFGNGPVDIAVEADESLAVGRANVNAPEEGRAGGRVQVVPRSDLSPGLYPFRVRVDAAGETRAYDASVLVSPGTLVLRPDDFGRLQGGMVRKEDPETGGSVLIVAPSTGGRDTARAEVDIEEAGDYYLWAYLGGGGNRAARFRLTVDGKKGYWLRRQGYEGLQIRECGLFWYWARGGKTRLEQGRHLLQLSAPADGSRFGALVLAKAPPDPKAFEALLDNLFLNRNFRPWLSD